MNERRTNRGASPEPQTESRMSRAQLLRAGAGAGAAALLAGSLGAGSAFASSGRADATTLNVYSWPNYFSTANLKAFKAKTGTSLNISTYEASDALFAKLNTAAGAGFDLAVPTGGWIPEMVSKGLLQKLDHDKLSFKNIDKNLLNKVYDKGNQYSIPKDYGVAGVVYDPAAVGGTIKTWSDFLACILNAANASPASFFLSRNESGVLMIFETVAQTGHEQIVFCRGPCGVLTDSTSR